ncbi:MAG: class IV adenylate cyclase [Spirochaetaceae bacterium]|jgi:adenylate cyclase class 2|nr:class IV adenylate cyclase [Spirochaetaceae bacterium]
MATEIELKARVEDPALIRKKLTDLAVFSGSFEKSDVYWLNPKGQITPDYGVRIRQETRKTPQGESARTVTVTYKTKKIYNGLEVNDEREFTVSDLENFEELLRRLGLAPGIGKRKQGWTWDWEGVTAELAEITGLGWFAELEILGGTDSPETVAASRSRLLTFLRSLGIGEDKIEPRPYAAMLQSAGAEG